MGNQRGEVVTGVGVMVVMMVVMMFFVMPFMHGGHKDHGDSRNHGKNVQKQEHGGMGPMHMHNGDGDPEKAAKSETEETK